MARPSFLIEGFINYRTDVPATGGQYDSFFLLKNGYIGEIGLDRVVEHLPLYLIQYTDRDGNRHLRKNPSGSFSIGTSEPTYQLEHMPDLRLGIWVDERSGQVHLSRDVFGFAPLFFSYKPGRYFAFSTDISRLVLVSDVAKETSLNVNKILLHNSGSHQSYNNDISSTFYSSIQSLLPGHILTVNKDNCKVSRYVGFNPQKWSDLRNTNEYVEALRHIFRKSVQDCIPGQGRLTTGSHLSGGLDSSSVTSMARHLYENADLHTFHVLSKSKEANEAAYAEIVANNVGSHHHILVTPSNDLSALELGTQLYGQPDSSFLSPANKHEMMANASKHGCKVLLNGFGGDSVIGSGFELIDQAFQSRNWDRYSDLLWKRTPYSAIAGEYDFWDAFSECEKFKLIFRNSLYRHLSKIPGRSLSGLIRIYRSIPPDLRPSPQYFLSRYLTGVYSRIVNNSMATSSQTSMLRNELEREYIHQTSQISFPTTIRGSLDIRYQEYFEDVLSPQVIKGQEEYFALGNHFEVRCHSPFMNRELLELNLAIPDVVKFGDGIGRAHFRAAMEGILSDKIRSRSTKATLSSSDGQEMTIRLYEQAKAYLFDGNEIWQYIDRKKLNEQVSIAYNDKVPVRQKTQTFFLLTRAISLAVWLEWLKKNASSTRH